MIMFYDKIKINFKKELINDKKIKKNINILHNFIIH